MLLKKRVCKEFPGGPVVRTLLSLPGVWVQSRVRELRSHKPLGTTKRKNMLLLPSIPDMKMGNVSRAGA